MGYIYVMERSIRLEIVLAGFLILFFCIIVLTAIALHLKERIELINAERQKLGKEKCDINNQLIQTRAEKEQLWKREKDFLAKIEVLQYDLDNARLEQWRTEKEKQVLRKVHNSLLKNYESEYEMNQRRRDKALARRIHTEEIQQDMLAHPYRYFLTEETVLGSTDELRFLDYLENLLRQKSTSSMKYVLLSQVSLHAYIQPISDLNKATKEIALALVGGKNTDFLVCRNVPKAAENLKPVVAIEINGKSHDTDERTIKNDKIKKALFDGLGIPLVSHKLGSGEYIQNEVAPYLE